MKKTVQTLLHLDKDEIIEILLTHFGLQDFSCKFKWDDGDINIIYCETEVSSEHKPNLREE